MTKRRKLAPRPRSPAQSETPEPAGAPPTAGAGGFWGGSAMNLLQRKLDAASTGLVDRIMQGLVVVELDPAQIEDEQGSDRQDDWKSAESLKSLIDDIERRGQSQPIRVRPLDLSWSPNPESPLDFSGIRFVVQSGRRRLESCRHLGIPVRAIIRTDQADALRLDLEERFLENTVRRDLSAFEELLSIGLIARAREDEEQKLVADELHVTPSDVSLGLACLEFFDTITAEYDANALAKRDFRQIIPEIRRRLKGKALARTDAAEPRPTPPPIVRSHGGLAATGRLSKKGFSLTVTGWSGDSAELERRIDDLLKSLSTKR